MNASSTSTPTILIVPGLRDHVEEHWQTILEKKHGNARSVPPLEHDKLSREARVAALDRALAGIEGPVVLVAHSAGVMIVAHWVRQHQERQQHQQYQGSIKGALLATPVDLESPLPPGYPTMDALSENGWLPIPRMRMPFPSIVAASVNDPLGNIDRVRQLANDWGSRFLDIGPVGHLNPAAGFGEWPEAENLIRELC